VSTAIAATPAVPNVGFAPYRFRHVHPAAPWFNRAVMQTSGLSRYYRLDEPSGTAAADLANGQTGTYTNTPTLGVPGLWTPGDAANLAATFAAAQSEYVSLPLVNFSGFSQRSFSLEVIFSVASLAARRFLFASSPTTPTAGQIVGFLLNTNGSIALDFSSDAITSAAGVIAAGTVYHAFATFDADADVSKVYVNGVQVATGSAGPCTAVPTSTQIGAWRGAETFDGTIDEFAVYNMALSAAEALRHAEAAGLAPTSTSSGVLIERSSLVVLGKAYAGTWLPSSPLPESPDLVTGEYTHRRDDSGEFSFTFPNKVSSDGVHWRERFATEGHLEFLEVYAGDDLEFVGSIQSLKADRGAVTVGGPDGLALLRKAHEPDRTWTAAAADVVANYARVPVQLFADDFADGVVDAAKWRTHFGIPGGPGIAPTTLTEKPGLFTLSAPTGDSGNGAGALTAFFGTKAGFAAGHDWDALVEVVAHSDYTDFDAQVIVTITDMSGLVVADVTITQDRYLADGEWLQKDALGPASLPAMIEIRKRGRWIYNYISGVLIDIISTTTANANLRPAMIHVAAYATTAPTVTIGAVVFRGYVPLLAVQADRVLPASPPPVGLIGRYWNNQDLEGKSAAGRLAVIFTPTREPYSERVDAPINTSGGLLIPPEPGSSGAHYSARWFGAVYIRGDLGDTQFRVSNLDDGCRLWVAKTTWGDQAIDDWVDGAAHTAGPVTIDSTLFGDIAGWVPIVLEYHNGAATDTLNLEFNPPGAGTYVDPGGSTITRGSFQTIPKTSLAPVGCFDQRVQGASHFDLVRDAAATFGYQTWLEPRSLESGEFPGRLTSKVRQGRDTDIVLKVADDDPIDVYLSPSVETDSADLATSLRGNGAGLPDGRGSQTTVEVFDMPAAEAALFDLQAVTDASDIGFPELLRARVDSELALRSLPWQNVTGTPRAQERMADTFPITGVYSVMRWRPGDAVRLWIPDIGVVDGAPRQMLQVTRTIAPEGRVGAQASFRQRPKSVASAVRRIARATSTSHRNYQGQLVTLPGEGYHADVVAAAAFSGYLRTALLGTDVVVRGWIRIPVATPAVSVKVEINGVDRTGSLGGPWSAFPVLIDMTPFCAQPTTDNRVYVRLQNNGGVTSTLEFETLVEVLR